MSTQAGERKLYTTPVVTDFGDLHEMTQAVNNFGNEDGGQKGVPGFGGTGTFS